MKHLKPYNKIYSMIVWCRRIFRCVSVYSCTRVCVCVCPSRVRLSCVYRYVFKRCLKICSHIYHVLRRLFFSTPFFLSFSFSDWYVFATSKGLVLCTFGPRDSIRQLILGAFRVAHPETRELEISARDIVDTYLPPSSTCNSPSSRIVICII